MTFPQEPSLIRPFRIPLHSLFACFLFCVPTFALTLFVLVTAEATQLYIVLGLMSSGLCVWSVLANTLQQRARLHVLGCALQFLNRRLASRFCSISNQKASPMRAHVGTSGVLFVATVESQGRYVPRLHRHFFPAAAELQPSGMQTMNTVLKYDTQLN